MYKLIKTFFLSIARNAYDLKSLFTERIPGKGNTSEKKRFLIMNWRDKRHKFSGGAEVYIHELGKRWVEQGHTVFVFCSNDGNCRSQEQIDGIHYIRKGGFYTVYIWACIYYFFKLRKHIDTVIDCQNGIPFFTPVYSKKTIFCLMFHVHQEVFHKSLVKPLAIFASFLEKHVMPLVYKRIKFLTISESSKQEMIKLGLGNSRIDIIHPGVDTKSFVPGKKSKKPMIVYVGRLKYYKSINVLIKTVKKIKESVPDVKVIIAGDGEERYRLKKLVKKLHLDTYITFLGKISEEDKIKLYQQAWVFVNPSLMEGWGITNIEANACGTPVVASNVPGLRDSVSNPHTGYLVPHGDVSIFTDKILLLLNNTKQREMMSKNAIQWAHTYDWDQSAMQSMRILLSQ